MAVFSSSLPRLSLEVKNNLYDIIRNLPQSSVAPVSYYNEKSDCIEFQHKADKFFEPKKKSKLKVRTVRDIRKEYEKYVYTYLKDDLEKQKNLIFKRIENGSAGEDDTINIAKKIFQSDQPKLRSTWFMIMKVNPLRKRHSIQYAFWNGVKIRLSGSRGGSDTFKWKYDISQTDKCLKRITKYKHRKQNYLLRSSLFYNFKPGPLSKKHILDKSYQKWTIGEATVVELPNASLVVEPKYNSALDLSILKYVEDLPDENGKLSENWANFALSALGTSINGSVVQKPSNVNIKFKLKYKNEQKLLLSRHDGNTFHQGYETESTTKQRELREPNDRNISAVVEELVRATVINVNQDHFFVEDTDESYKSYEVGNSKFKCSKLESANSELLDFPICQNKFCSLGCVCDALKYKYTKEHCGMSGCIFQCSCTVEKNRNYSEEHGGTLARLNSENNDKLYLLKRELKCQQTEEHNIKKSQRKKRKISKTCRDFPSELNSQHNSTVKEVSVKVIKLNCDNIETWCMVHNLYNCFCKGTIVECMMNEEYSCILNTSEKANPFPSNSVFVSDKVDKPVTCYKDNIPKVNISATKLKNKNKCEDGETNLMQTFDQKFSDKREDSIYSKRTVSVSNVNNKIKCKKDELNLILLSDQKVASKEGNKYLKRSFRVSKVRNKSKSQNDETDSTQLSDQKLVDEKLPYCETSMKCARTRLFKRRFKDDYYFTKNKKIMDMEMNDINLQKKLYTYFIKSLSPECTDTDRNPEENNHSFSKICEPSDLVTPTEPHKLIKNKAALISWLEAHYKRHKEKLESGSKIILEPPKPGKLALYPWEVLLERYREKKNFFLISRKPQHRIFIAVDCNNKFFKDCINIDEIRYSDLNKYPDTVKNLLTNTVNVKDTFYLLFGLAFCWELYGNVVKSKDTDKIQSFGTNSEHQNLLSKAISGTQKNVAHQNLNVSTSDDKDHNDICLVLPNTNDSDTIDGSSQTLFENKSKETNVSILDNSDLKHVSRWFFMTIEDDFDELQFVEKGFFVKYENIIKAIEVARSMKKTVRLSGLKCKGENNNPQFGIYALSDMEKLCVFVGPYDENEKLGMETIKGHRTYESTRKTRGSWLITKKIDNFKVIENPLSFLRRNTANINQNDSNNSESNSKKEVTQIEAVEQNLKGTSDIKSVDKKIIENERNKSLNTTFFAKVYSEKPLKVVKPITIRKADELFQIKNGPISLLKNPNSVTPKIIVNKNALTPKIYLNKNQIMKPIFTTISKNSTSNRSLLLPKVNAERGMLILKPEEINKKHADNKLTYCNEQLPKNCSKNNETPDIQSFFIENKTLKKVDSCSDDVLVISDDEDVCINSKPEKRKDVWIEISNVTNFGYLRGRTNEKNELSFQFPGFKFSKFYNEKEAFQMINEVLSRKVYLPKSLDLEWCILESKNQLKCKKVLKEEDFVPNLIMTKDGLVTKSEMRSKIQELFRSSFMELRAAVFYVTNKEVETVCELINEAEIVINKLEATGKKLETERNSLQEEVSMKKKKITEISSFLPEKMQNLVKSNLDLMDF